MELALSTTTGPSPSLYRPRQPQNTPLYFLLESFYDDVKAVWEERFERVYGFWGGFIDKVVFRYLDCGVLERGFARVFCPDCNEEYLLPFSCKCRGLCPSCGAKRAAAFAAFLKDELLEDVAHAQWVFTLPKMLRRYFLYNRQLLGELCRAAYDTVAEMMAAAVELLSWKHTGFSTDNSVTVYPSDELGLERLARYLIRSPVSLQRLHYLPETNQVLYQAKPGHDRGSSEILDPMEFVARVLTHIPDPNRHTIHYFGRYSNRAKPKSSQDSTSEELSDPKEPTLALPSKLRRRWADLIRRVYQTDPLVCPKCGSPMHILSFITRDSVIRRILEHLKNRAAKTRGPPIRKIQQAPLPFSP